MVATPALPTQVSIVTWDRHWRSTYLIVCLDRPWNVQVIGFRGICSMGEVYVTLFHRVFVTLMHFLWVLRGEMGVEVVSRWAVKLGAERTGEMAQQFRALPLFQRIQF